MSVENQERVCFCRTYSLILLFCNCLMDSPDAARDQWEVHVGRIVARCKVTQDDNRFWLANQEIIANTQNNYFAHKATKQLLEIHYLYIMRIRCMWGVSASHLIVPMVMSQCRTEMAVTDPRLDSVKVGNYVSLEQAGLNQIRLSIALSQVRRERERINKYSLMRSRDA